MTLTTAARDAAELHDTDEMPDLPLPVAYELQSAALLEHEAGDLFDSLLDEQRFLELLGEAMRVHAQPYSYSEERWNSAASALGKYLIELADAATYQEAADALSDAYDTLHPDTSIDDEDRYERGRDLRATA